MSLLFMAIGAMTLLAMGFYLAAAMQGTARISNWSAPLPYLDAAGTRGDVDAAQPAQSAASH